MITTAAPLATLFAGHPQPQLAAAIDRLLLSGMLLPAQYDVESDVPVRVACRDRRQAATEAVHLPAELSIAKVECKVIPHCVPGCGSGRAIWQSGHR